MRSDVHLIIIAMVSHRGPCFSLDYIGTTGLKAKIHHGWETSDVASQLQGFQFDPELMLLSRLGFSFSPCPHGWTSCPPLSSSSQKT